MVNPLPITDDDRVVCADCMKCTTHDDGGTWCNQFKRRTFRDQPLRCFMFKPRKNVADQRAGNERWPTRDPDLLRAYGAPQLLIAAAEGERPKRAKD